MVIVGKFCRSPWFHGSRTNGYASDSVPIFLQYSKSVVCVYIHVCVLCYDTEMTWTKVMILRWHGTKILRWHGTKDREECQELNDAWCLDNSPDNFLQGKQMNFKGTSWMLDSNFSSLGNQTTPNKMLTPHCKSTCRVWIIISLTETSNCGIVHKQMNGHLATQMARSHCLGTYMCVLHGNQYITLLTLGSNSCMLIVSSSLIRFLLSRLLPPIWERTRSGKGYVVWTMADFSISCMYV